MPTEQPIVSRATTRRAVVQTGAKLAYAAPLVAASMSLVPTGASAGIAAVVSGGGRTFVVDANDQDGVATGIALAAGQQFTVAASGLVRLCVGDGGRNNCPGGPDGGAGYDTTVCGGGPTRPCGSLVGTLNGTDFFIGAGGLVTAPVAGTLLLRVFDVPGFYANDNDGSFAVVVTV